MKDSEVRGLWVSLKEITFSKKKCYRVESSAKNLKGKGNKKDIEDHGRGSTPRETQGTRADKK